jgi:pentatricopeptide repeat protein
LFREDLYGAILHSLAVAGRQDEAEKLFQAMENGENSIPVEPGLLSYDALLFSRIENGDWEGALSLRNKMKERGISPSPQTVERIIEAHCGMGGKDIVSIAVQELLQDDDVRFAEGPFRSLSKILLPDIEIVSFDDFRQRIRSIGEEQSELRELSLNLVRSLRVAEIESERPSSPHKTEEEVRAVQDMAWKQSVKNLLEFANRFYSLQ